MILVIEILIITADIHHNKFDFYLQLPAQVRRGGAE